jgi:hypothetical protein
MTAEWISVASALVGNGFVIIESKNYELMMTGLAALLQSLTTFFWIQEIFSMGSTVLSLPLGKNIALESLITSPMSFSPSSFSNFEII